MTYLIDEELAQAIINYLARRPYAEVHEMIPRLMALQPAKRRK